MLKESLLQIGISEEQAETVLRLHAETLKDYVPKVQFDEAKAQVKASADQAAAQISAYKMDNAVNLQLTKSGAKDPNVVKHLVDLSKVSLEGDTITGLENQLDTLKEAYAYLFEPSMPRLSGREPSGGGVSYDAYNKENPFKKETFNLTAQSRLIRDNPEYAEKLRRLAN